MNIDLQSQSARSVAVAHSCRCSIGARMKTRRLTILIGSLVAGAIVLCVALTSYWYRTHPVLKERDASKLLAAVQAFSRDQVARRRPLPGSVTLRELTEGG